MKALLIVDMQNDFLPGGALPVPKAEELLPLINALAREFALVITCQDWHPPNHVSFGLWPVHCVQNTQGAELSPELDKTRIAKRFFKGIDAHRDSYSAFSAEGFAEYLKEKQVDQLVIVGIATEYCVLSTALDALEWGGDVAVIRKMTRAIDSKQGERALAEMAARGIKIL
ncbi:MAG: nicotinamidase [Verrucomicrobia bacterium]|nr:nicotinamidase [Verrucomicrobiota bacterium]